MASALMDHLYLRSKDALGQVRADERSETYVVSFFIYDEDDDPRQPRLTVGTNTESRVRFALDPPDDFVKPNPFWTPSDEGEARWNYAFWLQNELAVLGDSTRDPTGAAIREEWIRSRGWWVEEPVDDDWAEFEAKGEQITTAFVQRCVEVAQELHADGVVEQTFGRAIPIVVHELEYYDEIAAQTAAANPSGLAADFVRWIVEL